MSNTNSTKNAAIILLIAMLILVIGFHLILPLLGITIAVTAGMWGVAISAVVVLCIASLLFFVFTGAAILVTALIAGIIAIASIILFPLLFPLLIPLLLLMGLIALLRRKKEKNND